jgi:hypothetical protein
VQTLQILFRTIDSNSAKERFSTTERSMGISPVRN